MIKKELTFVATSDVSGRVRGKAFPTDQWDARCTKGVGWTPTNVQINCFDVIADSPFGALGDLVLCPDTDTAVTVDFQDGASPDCFVLGDITSLTGDPWDCCTRGHLKRALSQLHTLTGATLKGAFEHEFQLKGYDEDGPGGYTYKYFRETQAFAQALMQALDCADITPDTFLKEYGPLQFEVTTAPKTGVRFADEAVILRELTYSTAHRCGHKATFTPISDPSTVGNGVHIHLSFINDDGHPLTYDANAPHGMSSLTAQFVAGVLKYLPAIVAFTAPSKISYDRLTPHRWSAAYNNLGHGDREASVRICPVSTLDSTAIAKQYNFEYRAADASASPYLALAALVFAGTQGIKDALDTPQATQEDLSLLSPQALRQRGYERLPTDLQSALNTMKQTPQVAEWFGQNFVDIYLAHKQSELATLEDKTDPEIYRMYGAVY